ncbi:MAG: alpha/beta hydrolase [Pseudomonadota bacterium]
MSTSTPPDRVEPRPTAGLRGASWNVDRLPAGMRTTVAAVPTHDGAQITGYLHACGGEKTVVVIMHPRELLVTHYLVPYIVAAGYACWVQGPRTVGNDIRLEHEVALLDVAAGLQHLQTLGFDKTVLLGNSGGASLFAFYNQQASLGPEQRLSRTPGMRPVKLGEAPMPAVDGLVFVAPHPGQGRLLMNCIDPSVTDEARPLQLDATLNPFLEANGFRPRPQSSQYTPAFAERYRAAQRARVARIDASAKKVIADRLAARGRAKAGGSEQDTMEGAFNAIFEVWRTDADLRAFDLTMDASDRRWGTVWGADPAASNLGAVGFGRVCTAESWLSTWSGLASNASFDKCGAAITQPALMVYYTGDNTVFPSDADEIYSQIAAKDKARVNVKGNHHGHALAAGDVWPQDVAGAAIAGWLQARFPVR